MTCHNCNSEMDRFPRHFEDTLCKACKQKEVERQTRATRFWVFCILVSILFTCSVGAGYFILKVLAILKYLSS